MMEPSEEHLILKSGRKMGAALITFEFMVFGLHGIG
jgi:hypothetical protein